MMSSLFSRLWSSAVDGLSANKFSSVGDAELVLESLQGDQYAFQNLVERYKYPIDSYVLKLLRFQRQDADEVGNETWLKTYNNLAHYDTQRPFLSWVFRIAHNTSIDFIRKNKKIAQTSVALELHTETGHAQYTELSKQYPGDIEDVLSKLNHFDRQLVELRFLEEKTLDELTLLLGVPKKKLSVQLFRALKRAQKWASNAK